MEDIEKKKSVRKPHNGDAGYICEKIFKPTGSHIVIYLAEKQKMDVDGLKYAVFCSKHTTLMGETSLPKARVLMKSAEFCEECMKSPSRS